MILFSGKTLKVKEEQNLKINAIEINWNDESGVTIDQLANQNEGEM